MTDPWQIQQQPAINNEKDNFASNISNASKREESLEFEDNFAPNTNNSILQPLPDSASYLRSLERKLQKIQKESKLLDALGEKRQQCLRTLLQEDTDDQAAAELEQLEESDDDAEEYTTDSTTDDEDDVHDEADALILGNVQSEEDADEYESTANRLRRSLGLS